VVCTSSPIITANWLTAGDKAWTLPFGGGIGHVVKIGGKLPVNLSLSAYYNALRPEFGSTGSLGRNSCSSSEEPCHVNVVGGGRTGLSRCDA
jgi:hypothetical protein